MQTKLRELFDRRGGDISVSPEMPPRLPRRVRFHRVRYAMGALAVAVASLGAVTAIQTLDRRERTVPGETPNALISQARWRALPEAPIEGRIASGAVWTGREMIIWGGVSRQDTVTPVAEGAAYDPATDAWRTIAPAPPGVLGVVGTAAAWTGRIAVFWAGNSPDGPAAGAAYDPVADSWQRLPDGPLGPREGYTSVWTGTELLIVGGAAGDTFASPFAAAVDPDTGTWRLLDALNELPGLAAHGAVWDGSEVFLAGLRYLCPEEGSGCDESRPTFLAYDPADDAVREIDLTLAPVDPEDRGLLEPIAWAGGAVVFSSLDDPSAGLVSYDPARDDWTAGSAAPCAAGDSTYSQAAWLEDRFVLTCGEDQLQVYETSTDTWQVIDAGASPMSSRVGSAIAWTGTDLIVWSGTVESRGNPTPNDGAAITLTCEDPGSEACAPGPTDPPATEVNWSSLSELPPPRRADFRSEFVSDNEGYLFWPRSGPAEVGVAYRFDTGHCGLGFMTDLDGSFWEPVEPDGGEPPDFFYNQDVGAIALVSADTAIYRSSGGMEITLVRIDGPVTTPLCA